MEPFKLRRWNEASSPHRLNFYTCARPGRSNGPSGDVPDDVVHKWFAGLPKGDKTVIVSLLGQKPDGMSEFAFYSFRGEFDQPRRRQPTFSDWIAKAAGAQIVKVVEHPTCDLRPVPPETIAAVLEEIRDALQDGWTVILVDSGGETRSRAICKQLQLVEDSRTM